MTDKGRAYLTGLLIAAAVAYVAAWIGGLAGMQSARDPLAAIDRAVASFDPICLLMPWLMPVNEQTALWALIGFGGSALIIAYLISAQGHFDYGKEYGDARWATRAEIARIGDQKRLWNNIPYTEDCKRAIIPFNDATRKISGATSLNTCIVGSTGAGKDYRYVDPLLMQLIGNALPYVYRKGSSEIAPPLPPSGVMEDTSADLFITDSKASIARECGWLLEDAGYDIKVFDIIRFLGTQYNPFSTIPARAVDAVAIEDIAVTVSWAVDGIEQEAIRCRFGDITHLPDDAAAPGKLTIRSSADGAVTLDVRALLEQESVLPYEENDALLSHDVDDAIARIDDVAVARINQHMAEYSYTRSTPAVCIIAQNNSAAPADVDVRVAFGRFTEKPVIFGYSHAFDSHSVHRDDRGAWYTEAVCTLAGGHIKTLRTAAAVRTMRVADTVELVKNVDCFVKNLKEPDKPEGDAFWEEAERMMLMMIIAYLFERYSDSSLRNLAEMLRYLNMAKVDFTGTVKSPLDIAFDEWESGMRYVPAPPIEDSPRAKATHGKWEPTAEGAHDPMRSLAVYCYNIFHQGAAETLQSILISCSTATLNLFTREVQEMTRRDDLHLDSLGDPGRRRAIICVVDDMDHSYDYLFAMMVYQVISLNCRKADSVYGGKLPRPVHLILNEFANIATIPGFDRKIAVTRSRNLFFHVILQSLQQLRVRYGEAASVIRDNCSALLFLGGQSEETLKGLEELAGTETIEEITTSVQHGTMGSSTRNRGRHGRQLVTVGQLRMLDSEEAVVMISGQKPFKGRKNQTNRHPLYRHLYSDHERPRGAPDALHTQPWTYQGYLERKEAKRRAPLMDE